MRTEWELCSPMKVDLPIEENPLHLQSTRVSSDSDSCRVMRLSRSFVLSNALYQEEALKLREATKPNVVH